MKIVINKCYGGFGLSDAAMHRYAEIKGITLYPEKGGLFNTYYTVSEDQRVQPLAGNWKDHSLEVRKAYNERSTKEVLYDRDMVRDDPILIQVVEELGETANGRCASLKIVEIPDDVEWTIGEYDGQEWIAEKHRTWE
jgi:hypothetical protein